MSTANTLSIIVPCFNCEKTLVYAIDSIYTQALRIPFEVVLVNDASTDGTSTLIRKLIRSHENIRTLSHTTNLGGGAARNSGIRASKSNLIYCLDSDNVLAPNSLNLLIDTLRGRNADGVAFQHRLFFRDSVSSSRSMITNTILDRSIILRDLFRTTSVSLDNFLMTKKAWEESGGFPEHHGFDTQSFELRFLGTGHTIWIAPDSKFFHRRFQRDSNSYFEREYERGAYSLNTYLCFEDILHLFHPTIRSKVIEYNVFSQTSFLGENLWTSIRKLYKENPDEFFIPNLNHYSVPVGANNYWETMKKSSDKTDLFCHALWKYKKGDFAGALIIFEQMANQKMTPILSYNILRASIGLSKTINYNFIEKYAESLVRTFVPAKKQNELRSLPHFAVAKLRQSLMREK